MAYQPKSYKKFVATAATATLVASAIAPVASANSNTAAFTDVSANYKVAVDYLVENNISQGYTETQFGVQMDIKRGDAAIILAKALGIVEDENAAPSGFSDVPTRGALFINTLKEAGIINGKTATNFGFNDPITRGEVALIMARAAAYNLEGDVSELKFTDVADRYKEAVAGLVEAGITQGKSATQFGTNDPITRGEYAIFVYKAETMTPATPEVVSVSAINATEVVVDFSVLLDKTDAETVGNYKIGAVSPTSATLNSDKKSVTLKFANASDVEVTNSVFVVEPIQTAADASVETAKYTQVFSFEDTIRPTVTGVSYPTNATAKVTLSEAVDVLDGTELADYITVTDANGADITDTTLYTLSADKKSFTVNTAGFTKGLAYSLSIVGLKDLGGNLISPNPAVVNITKTEVDSVLPTVTSVTSLDTNKFKVVFSEALDTTGTYFTYDVDASGTPVTVNSANATMNDAGTEFIVDLGAPLSAGPHAIAIDSYEDPSANAGNPYSKLVNFAADTTNPTVASTSVKTLSGVRYIAVTFTEEVTLNAQTVNFSYVQDGVYKTGTIAASSLAAVDLDENGVDESVLINTEDFDGLGNALKSGVYSISLPSGLVTDTSQNTNDNAATTVKVTLGDLTSTDTTKPGIAGVDVQSIDNDTVEVTFSEDVSNETALNLANYTVEGKQVFDSAVFYGDKTTVRLTLKAGAIKLNGDYQVVIKNIKDTAGNLMNTVTRIETFTENTAPALSSAVLTANNVITLKFNEDMNVLSIQEALAEADFEVFVNGVAETGVTEASTDARTFTLTLADALNATEYNSTITLKPTVDFDVEDANGNAHPTFTSVTVTK
ncbi:S-layer homology domain-containing protein [Paenisporosarcina cavernae]|nr:S-layer homology domain-containing protein [Paenisporosarcina cavernae]